LGYQLDASGLASLAAGRALDNHQLELHRLYEQARRLRLPGEQTQQRVVEYLKRWRRWTKAGLLTLTAHRTLASNMDQAKPWDVMMPAGILVTLPSPKKVPTPKSGRPSHSAT